MPDNAYVLVLNDIDSRKMKGLKSATDYLNTIFDDLDLSYHIAFADKFEEIELPDLSADNVIIKLLPTTEKSNNYGCDFLEYFTKIVRLMEHKVSEQYGSVTYVNDPDTIIQLRNKVVMSDILLDSGVPHPKRYQCDAESLLNLITESEAPICIKPISGTIGKGVTKIKYYGHGTYKVDSTFNKKSISRKKNPLFSKGKYSQTTLNKSKTNSLLEKLLDYGVIVQDWITPLKILHKREMNIFDVRELLIYPQFTNESISTLLRISNNKLVTNISASGEEGSYHQYKAFMGEEAVVNSQDLAIQACKAFKGLNITGVDVIWSYIQLYNNPFGVKIPDGMVYPYVIELNAFPGTKTAFICGVFQYFAEILGALKDSGVDLNPIQERLLMIGFNNVRGLIDALISRN
jgi:glutathione synthase/RimK-type ligase-like ATP-grasp enzyme